MQYGQIQGSMYLGSDTIFDKIAAGFTKVCVHVWGGGGELVFLWFFPTKLQCTMVTHEQLFCTICILFYSCVVMKMAL